MATLSSALNYALAGLSVSAAQSSIVSRNVSSASEENYTRKTAEIRTLPGGAPAVTGVSRSTDRQLLEKLLLSSSDAAGKQVSVDALNRLSALTGDPQDDRSIAASIGKLQQALRGYQANPSSATLARSALAAAGDVARKLNEASGEVVQLRSEADEGLAASAERINNLLSQFKVVNDSIVRGQGTAGELGEALDQRDGILKLLSEEIGIRTSVRANNDIMIYADGGSVLFEGYPRTVSFAASGVLGPGAGGNALFIDGVAVTGAGAAMPAGGGKIAAYAAVRDTLVPRLSRQLDLIAGGLVTAFAERDQSSPAARPDVEGLFLGTGTPPSVSSPPEGLAGRLRLNPLADSETGGSPFLLRDGGFGGPAYVYNAAGQPGYQARLAELATVFDQAQAFGTSAGLGGTVSVKSLAVQSASWVEGERTRAQAALDEASAMRSRAGDSLLQVTGVNIDQEMAKLLDLEKGYQASSKVLSVVNAMLAKLMEAVG